MKFSSPVVMAILNVTPDSFYAASRHGYGDIEHAVAGMVEAGAGIIDVGGYSSRPGADDVSADEEFRRVAQGVGVVRRLYPGMTVSVDTFRAVVARRVVERFGECVINDISAGGMDKDMIPTVAELGVPYIAMHMRGTPADMQRHTDYQDVVAEVERYFVDKIAELRDAGMGDIIIDPGFGFAKTAEQNHRLLADMDRLCAFGCPVLAGVSRKSMIYKPLGITPEESLPGTIALGWEALRRGASILRVHDVAQAVQTVRLFEFFQRSAVPSSSSSAS